jgi:hypothetical protein
LSGLIDDEVNARGLARAIISDLKLYNAHKLQAGESIEEEISEGRALYADRVAVRWGGIFETEVEQAFPGAGRRLFARPSRTEVAEVGRLDQPRPASPEGTPRPPRSQQSIGLMIVIIILAAVLAVAVVLLKKG